MRRQVSLGRFGKETELYSGCCEHAYEAALEKQLERDEKKALEAASWMTTKQCAELRGITPQGAHSWLQRCLAKGIVELRRRPGNREWFEWRMVSGRQITRKG